MQITMDELRATHNCNDVIKNGPSTEIILEKKNTINDANGKVSAVNKVWSGDKRLSLYGYSLETINLLLLPMVKTKYVHQQNVFSKTFSKIFRE